MSEEINANKPSGNPDSNPVTPSTWQTAVEQRIVALETDSKAKQNTSVGKNLVAQVRWGERWLITINGLSLLASIGIGIIYICQLKEMQKANVATGQALIRADQNSLDSSKQFQVQLSHFDDGLGRTGLLAIHAGSKLLRLKMLQ